MTRLLLTLSSLAPLLVIVAIRMTESSLCVSVALGVLAVCSGLLLPVIFRLRRNVEPQPFVVQNVRDDSAQVPVYVVTFIFPFAFAEASTPAVITSYWVFAALMFLLILKTDLSLVNPILLIFGLRVFVVTNTQNKTHNLISRDGPKVGDQIQIYPVLSNVYGNKS